MHLSNHDEWLPEGVPPAVLPDSTEDARLLASLLEIGFLPTAVGGGSGAEGSAEENPCAKRPPTGLSGGERAAGDYSGALPTQGKATSKPAKGP